MSQTACFHARATTLGLLSDFIGRFNKGEFDNMGRIIWIE